jgi:hypothetical protein
MKSTSIYDDPRGFICKIGDFGLSRVLDCNATHVSTGTYGQHPATCQCTYKCHFTGSNAATKRPQILLSLAAYDKSTSCIVHFVHLVVSVHVFTHAQKGGGTACACSMLNPCLLHTTHLIRAYMFFFYFGILCGSCKFP